MTVARVSTAYLELEYAFVGTTEVKPYKPAHRHKLYCSFNSITLLSVHASCVRQIFHISLIY